MFDPLGDYGVRVGVSIIVRTKATVTVKVT